MKLCAKCNKAPRAWEGQSYCKPCAAENRRLYDAKNPTAKLLTKAKQRAKDKNIEFNITIDDIVIPEYCPVLSIKLERGDGVFTQSSPSLDRIDSTKGYVKGNVEVISFRANNLKGDATPEELALLYKYYN